MTTGLLIDFDYFLQFSMNLDFPLVLNATFNNISVISLLEDRNLVDIKIHHCIAVFTLNLLPYKVQIFTGPPSILQAQI